MDPTRPYVINADGSGLKQLANVRGDFTRPQWSPDGRTIAFNTEIGIYTVDPNGSHLRVLIPAPPMVRTGLAQYFVSWAPQGGRILYDRAPATKLAPSASVKSEVWVAISDGTGRRRLYSPGCCQGYLEMTWSPDGKRIAFSSFLAYYLGPLNAGKSGLFVMDANGSHRHRLLAGVASELAWQAKP